MEEQMKVESKRKRLIAMVISHKLVTGPNLDFSQSATVRRLWTSPATANESLTAQHFQTGTAYQVAKSARVPN